MIDAQSCEARPPLHQRRATAPVVHWIFLFLSTSDRAGRRQSKHSCSDAQDPIPAIVITAGSEAPSS